MGLAVAVIATRMVDASATRFRLGRVVQLCHEGREYRDRRTTRGAPNDLVFCLRASDFNCLRPHSWIVPAACRQPVLCVHLGRGRKTRACVTHERELSQRRNTAPHHG